MPKKTPTPDFGYTPEQIKEMQDFFKSNDFTANFSLQHEITLTGAKAEVFNKAKYSFAKYWLDNLPALGIKRQMKNFAKEYPIKLLQETDGTYFSEQMVEIYNDPKRFESAVNQFVDMYGEQIYAGCEAYAQSIGKEVEDLTDEEISFVVDKVANVLDEELIKVLMLSQQVPEVFGVSQKVQQHEDFNEKLSKDKINFYNKWTHANTKLGAPLLFCEIYEEDENGEIISDESNGIEGAKNFFDSDPEADALYKLLKEDFFSTLSETDREILNLHEKGFNQKEIAQRLGYKTHSAISKRMKVLNADFKKYLGFTD